MPLREIAKWIENNTAWEIGVNMFVGHLPLKTEAGTVPPAHCITLLENSPGPVEGQLPDRKDKMVQIRCRAKKYSEADIDAQALFDLMHGTHGWNLPVLTPGRVYLAMTVDAMGTPAPIENPDEKGRTVFSTNYMWKIEDGSC